MNVNRLSRKLHRWGAIIIAIPIVLVIVTGLLLQVKKQWTWVQPPTQKGSHDEPSMDFARILAVAQSVPEANVSGWKDIDRLDVRPSKGIVKVQTVSRWELQIDSHTGDVLSSVYRRSDLIESLHDGSWFHDRAKLWIFLPNGLILLGLWLTGVHLWFLPRWMKSRNRRRRAEKDEG